MGLLTYLSRRKPKFTHAHTQPVDQPIEGRRHRTDVPYILPMDAQEDERLNFQHHFLRGRLKGNYTAPLLQPASILDVGCGTGVWAKEMAQTFPEAQVTGLDLEQPMLKSPPPRNCRFVQGNVFVGLPFPDACFDYVHQRLLVAAIPAAKWPTAINELVRVTRLGGSVELLEAGDTFPNAGPQTQQFLHWWAQASNKAGFDMSLMTHLDEMLRNAGLKQVQKQTLTVPLGKWGGREGIGLAKDLHAIFVGTKAFYLSHLPITADQFETAVGNLINEWERYQTSYEFYVAYGQR